MTSQIDFANMGYLMLLSERTFHKDLKTKKKVLKYVYLIECFGAKFVTSFSHQKCQNLKNKKT